MPPDRPLGVVKLVGAGPGPADLMTVRAHLAVRQAQVLLYDALVDPEVLGLAPAACLKIQTGKRANKASLRQDTINSLMLRLVRRGLDVVRLKGGDPSMFGRSGEETAFLKAHGVEVEVIAGVTAASAAAAQFGFPLTHRRSARRVVLATARIEEGELARESELAADPEATLVLYMARDSFAAVSRSLIAAGRSPTTPCLAVENAGRADARRLAGALADLPTQLISAACQGPVIIIVGDVVALACSDPGELSAHTPLGRCA